VDGTASSTQAQQQESKACALELEGIVSKRKDGRYHSGRNIDWVKVTCRHRDTFYIAGLAYNRGKFDGVYLAPRGRQEAGLCRQGGERI
jgi:ATP-dependent DNA ligase